MMCARPFRLGVLEHGCGQCMPCRINRRRLWTLRLMLESCLWPADQSHFVTLTYAPEHVPPDMSVSPRAAQLWLKRIRVQQVREFGESASIRYFVVGEYGEKTARPHYHAVLFGLRREGLVGESWPFGFVSVSVLESARAHYAAGYVTKKMTKADDPRLGGRHPEFARMSLKPGLGAGAMGAIADVVTSEAGCLALIESGDVPSQVRLDGKVWPIGRYLRSRVRVEAGMDKRCPEESIRKRALEVIAELSVEGAREARENKREVSRLKAEWFSKRDAARRVL